MILLVNESTKIIEHLFTTKMYGQEITPKPGKASDFNAYLDFLAFLFWQASIFHCTPGSTGVRPNTPLVSVTTLKFVTITQH